MDEVTEPMSTGLLKVTARSTSGATWARLPKVPWGWSWVTLRLARVVLGSQRPQLERTTALAAPWRRGDRAFVEAHGRDSREPALRSKARALRRAAGRAD